MRAKLQSAWLTVAVFLGALGLTARRTASVSLPLTAVAATVALGPVQLLPHTDGPAPSRPRTAPSVRAAEAPARAAAPARVAVAAPAAAASTRPVAVPARRTPGAAPAGPTAPAPSRRPDGGHHEECGCQAQTLPVTVSADVLQGTAGVQLGRPGSPSTLQLFLSLR